MKTLRRDILKLISTWISKSTDANIVISEFLNPLSQLIVDYNNNVPDARDPEVLFLFAIIINSFGGHLVAHIPSIVSNLFSSTLQMISSNFVDYMDFRRGFFTLIKNIVLFSMKGLYSAGEQDFKTFIDSIIWAFKHDIPDLAEIGLQAMSELIS